MVQGYFARISPYLLHPWQPGPDVTPPPAPTLSALNPTSGAVGTSVTLTGANLTGATAVRFGTSVATFTVLSDTSITTTVPAGAISSPITVSAPGGVATSATFTVTTAAPAAPTLSGFTPTSGPVGTTVVLTGTNLSGATAVKFGTVSAFTFTATSNTSISVTVPVGAVTGKISVVTPAGTAVSAGSFTVTTTAPAAPTLSGFTPTSGVVGSTVGLTGTGLAGATSVKFGTLSAVFTVASDTSITATVPAGAVTGKVSVVTAAGTALSAGSFVVTATPPPSTGGYGGTAGWTVFHTYDLTRNEGPWGQTTGVRNTDSSYNRAAQTTFGPGGMTITAERASDTAQIFSSDAQARYMPLPDYFALEADVNLADYLGVGMFPALWWRPAVGSKGEIDGFEYCGKFIGTTVNGGREMKLTLIETTGGTPYNLGQDQRGFGTRKANPPWNGTFAGFHRWRWEKTPGLFALWVDGIFIDSITKASFDSHAGTGAWDNTIEYGGTWYTRLTYQVGPGTGADLAGPVPAGWRQSRLIVSRMVAYSKG